MINTKNKTIVCVLWIILILVVVFLYWGCTESTANYINIFGLTYGVVEDSEIEHINMINSDDTCAGIDSFVAENMYKVKFKYSYIVNKTLYYGHFYNDESDDIVVSVIDDIEVKSLLKKYNKNYPLKVYYDKQSPDTNCVSLEILQIKNSKFYYGCAFLLFIFLTIILFFSDFLISKQ